MTPHSQASDAFAAWQRTLEEGTQAWLRALGQSSPAAGVAPPPPDFSQFWRPLLTQGLDAWQKAAAHGGVSPDLAQQWKAFMDQWVEACSKALGQAMATEGFAQALGRYLDQMLAVQGPMAKGLEQYTDQALRTLGLPSRSQVVGLASQVVGLEERLEAIEERLDALRDLLRPPPAAAPRPEAGAQGSRRGRAVAPRRSRRGHKEA
jgi:hypothetical protein